MPSRKIISILILTSAVVAGIIILASSEKVERNNKGQVVALDAPEVKLTSQNTSDWKKDLSILPASSGVSTTSAETLTDQVSQSLVANYLAIKQQGKLDEGTVQKLINQASEAALQPKLPKYTSANLLISTDNSQNAVRVYGAQLGNAFKINAPITRKDEIDVFSAMLQNKDVSEAENLLNISRYYQNIAESLVGITVPSSYTSLHLQLVNGYNEAATSLKGMATFLNDPLKALGSLYSYQVATPNIINSSTGIKTKILKDGVFYKQGESGYYFYYGI